MRQDEGWSLEWPWKFPRTQWCKFDRISYGIFLPQKELEGEEGILMDNMVEVRYNKTLFLDGGCEVQDNLITNIFRRNQGVILED